MAPWLYIPSPKSISWIWLCSVENPRHHLTAIDTWAFFIDSVDLCWDIFVHVNRVSAKSTSTLSEEGSQGWKYVHVPTDETLKSSVLTWNQPVLPEGSGASKMSSAEYVSEQFIHHTSDRRWSFCANLFNQIRFPFLESLIAPIRPCGIISVSILKQ